MKKIVLEKKIISNNFIKREKFFDKKSNFISPEIKRKNNPNLKKTNIGNKLFLENIICYKKEKSFDSKHSMKNSTKNSLNKIN